MASARRCMSAIIAGSPASTARCRSVWPLATSASTLSSVTAAACAGRRTSISVTSCRRYRTGLHPLRQVGRPARPGGRVTGDRAAQPGLEERLLGELLAELDLHEVPRLGWFLVEPADAFETFGSGPVPAGFGDGVSHGWPLPTRRVRAAARTPRPGAGRSGRGTGPRWSPCRDRCRRAP